MATNNVTSYPLPKFFFQVEWGGTRIGFTEISGLDMSTDPIEYREGSSPQFSKTKMPGLHKFSNVTMKRGIFESDNDYYKWFNTIALNTVDRRTVTISLLDETKKPVVVWTLSNAWPVKLTSTDLKADGNEAAIESLEVAHEGLTISNPA